jgi:protoheme IX farnesyltransferase
VTRTRPAPGADTGTLPGLLAAAAVGVYLLLLVGATTAVTDAAAACAAWPACGDGASLPTTAAGALALGHRLVAVVVGLLVLATTAAVWRRDADRRTRLAVTGSALLYPVQAALGAVVAVGAAGATPLRSGLHLALGLAIFGGLVVALARTLERATGDPTDDGVDPAALERPPGEPVATAEGRATGLLATVRAYVSLTKPRLMWLLCLVAGASMALAGGERLTPHVVVATLGGGVLSIGASATFNHVLERDVDRRMARTSDRALAVDLVPVRNAVAFGLLLAAGSLVLFASVDLLAAALGLVAIVFYSVVYTLLLKPNTVQNTVVGGAAGALPALIGWAAVTGTVGPAGLALALVVFLWTPAHFYNLALAYRDDYERGGFPMFPVVHGATAARRHVLYYLGATLAAAAALAPVDALGVLYALTSVVLGGVFLWAVVRLHYERSESAAFRAFHASNAYLGALLIAVVVDATVV